MHCEKSWSDNAGHQEASRQSSSKVSSLNTDSCDHGIASSRVAFILQHTPADLALRVTPMGLEVCAVHKTRASDFVMHMPGSGLSKH